MTSVQPAYTHTDLHCLLIDQDDRYVKLFNASLADAGYRCSFHDSSISEAPGKADLADIQVIFLHAAQQGQTPVLLLQTLREQHPHIPVIAFEHQFSRFRNQSFLGAGASEYIALQNMSAARLQRLIRYTAQTKAKLSDASYGPQTDPLTGLPNRYYFCQQLELALQDMPEKIALLNIDLDGFSRFNHLNGSLAGDRIIQLMAQRITSLSDTLVARMSADEFSLYWVDENISEASIKHLCEQLLHSLSEPYHCGNEEFTLPCSIGISIAQPDQDVDSLAFQAHQARLQAKQYNECHYCFFVSSLPDADNSQSDLEPDLILALQKEQFELFYQPRVDIRTGTIIGAEALIRWRHPERGLISPGEFIELAERNGLIVPIGYWVIYRAGMDMQTINQAGLDIGRIGVNLSFRQFEDRYLSRTIQRLIEKYQIDTSVLEFELTESALFSNEAHIRQGIEQLNELGVSFSLDDFGTGYSSFTLLQKLPINSLKIDRSFTSGVIDSQDDREIVKAIINLAHSLHIEVVAEGVETRDQHDFLIEHNCYQAQGFLYSRPTPFKDFFNMLQNGQQQKTG